MYVSSSAYLASGRRGSRSPVHINQPIHCRGSPSIQSIDFTVHLFSRLFAYQSTSARLASGRRGSRSPVHIVSPSIPVVAHLLSRHTLIMSHYKDMLTNISTRFLVAVSRLASGRRGPPSNIQGTGFGVEGEAVRG